MLVTQGFSVGKVGRIINPAAIFCNDREIYFKMLGKADSFKKDNTLQWYEYVLGGLKHEVQKIDFAKIDPIAATRSRYIKHLKDRKLIIPITQRKYILRLYNGPLIYGIIAVLDVEGFTEGKKLRVPLKLSLVV